MHTRLWKFMLAAAACLLACAAAGCTEQASSDSSSVSLNPPENLSIDNDILSWDACPDATGYSVTIGATVYQTDQTSLDLFPLISSPELLEIEVRALLPGIITSSNPATIPYDARIPESALSYEFLSMNNTYRVYLESSGYSGKIIVPAYVNDLPVSSVIGFSSSSVSAVYLPDSVTLSPKAFSDAASLKRIRLPSALPKLPWATFSGCSSLQSVSLPASVTEIGTEVFSGCESLASISVSDENPVFYSENNCILQRSDNLLVAGCSASVIPESASKIGDYAFCTISNRTISIPDSVTEIGYQAFAGSKLTEIHFSPYVSYIDNLALVTCNDLKSITVDQDNPVYRSENNCLIRKADDTLVIGCSASVIPDSVSKIGDCAFGYCHSLTQISIPDSVTEIGNDAFFFCTSLQEVCIPASVVSMGSRIFCSCTDLQKASILTTADLGVSAFSECTSLREVSFVQGIQKIGDLAFLRCPSLTEVTIPYGVTYIGFSAFSSCISLEKLWIPEGVIDILNNAIINCPRLCTTMPESATSLGVQMGLYPHPVNTALYASQKSFEAANLMMLGFPTCEISNEDHYPYVVSATMLYHDVSLLLNHWSVPVRRGYTFLGWATEENGSPVYTPTVVSTGYPAAFNTPSKPVSLTEEQLLSIPVGTTLYAVWGSEAPELPQSQQEKQIPSLPPALNIDLIDPKFFKI